MPGLFKRSDLHSMVRRPKWICVFVSMCWVANSLCHGGCAIQAFENTYNSQLAKAQ